MRSFLDTLGGLKNGGTPDELKPRDGAFMFATGLECSYPTVDGGRMRRDLQAFAALLRRYGEPGPALRWTTSRAISTGSPRPSIGSSSATCSMTCPETWRASSPPWVELP